MVSFGGQMEAGTSNGVLVVKIGPFVFKKHIDNPRMAIPAGNFQRHPLLSSLEIGVRVLLEQKVIHDGFISHRASNMQRWEFVVAQVIKIYDDIIWHSHGLLLVFVELTLLHIHDFGLLDLVLLDEPHQLLFLTAHPNHIVDLINEHSVADLPGLDHFFHLRNTFLLLATSEARKRSAIDS